jgi:hypothetical protein
VIQNSYQWLMGEIDKSQLVMMGSGQTEYAEVCLSVCLRERDSEREREEAETESESRSAL